MKRLETSRSSYNNVIINLWVDRLLLGRWNVVAVVESFICSVDISSDGMLINALGKLNVSIVVSKMLYNVKDTRVNEMRKWILLRLESL